MTIDQLFDSLIKFHSEFWKSKEFWITFSLSFISIIITIFTLIIAKGAKKAALDTKRGITSRNIEYEMNEVLTSLKNIPRDINYIQAKQIVITVNCTLNKIIQLLKALNCLEKDDISNLEKSIELLNTSLGDVRPDNEKNISNPYIISDGLEPTIKDLLLLLSRIIGKIQAKDLKD